MPMMHEGNVGSSPRERAPAAGPDPRRGAGSVRHVRRALGAAALALLSTAPAPASAQWFSREEIVRESPVVTPGEVVRLLARRGYDEFTRPHFTGAAYVVDATDRRGDRVRVVVDAYEGEIRRIRLLEEERLSGALPWGRSERLDDRPRPGRFEGDDERFAEPQGRQALRSEPSLRTVPPPPAKPRKPESPATAVSPSAPALETGRKPASGEAPIARAPDLGLKALEPLPAPAIEPRPAEPRTEARGPVRVIDGVTPVILPDGRKAE